MHIADQDGGLKQLDFVARGHVPPDLSAANDGSGGDRASDNCILADHEHPLRMNLAFKGAIELDGAFEVDDAFKHDVFSENGETLAIRLAVGSFFFPHDESSLFSEAVLEEP